jgi:hypothetical protein
MVVSTRQRFPTLGWFQALGEAMNNDVETFRKLGFIDARVGIVVQADEGQAQSRAYTITFGAYTCDGASEIDPIDPTDVDFTLQAPYGTWKEMIANIEANDGADLRHTLNYLHFGRIELKATDQLRADLFFRVNSSLQAFFDNAATFKSDFPG